MSGFSTGLDRMLEDPRRLKGRRFALLSHSASVAVGTTPPTIEPIHLALVRRGVAPTLLLGPEHGYFGVEQDMIAAADSRDLATGATIRSLYGDHEGSLRPAPGVFDGVDLLLIDLQDVGARYYTYAATAAWAAEVALAGGAEVMVLDRPNPLGGEHIEGPPLEAGYESFVGAFPMPTRHGLTVGELVRRHLRQALGTGARGGVDGFEVAGWSGGKRGDLWPRHGRPFLAPSPNLPSFETAVLYPGLCLLEGTTLSEGRGTTRPFRLLGAPGINPYRLAVSVSALAPTAVAAVPTYFRPQFQKHAGEVCAGLELIVTDPVALAPVAFGCRLLDCLWREFLESGGSTARFWRAEAYEFVTDRPAIDLLAGSSQLRELIEAGDRDALESWIGSWGESESRFRADREVDLEGVAP